MQIKKLESKDNPLVKRVVKLVQTSNYRKESGYCVVYGCHLIEEAIKCGILETIIINEKSVIKYSQLLDKSKQIEVYLVNSAILAKLNILGGDVDIVGIVRIPDEKRINFATENDYILLEKIQDPGNLGAILRVAKASGINNVCLSKDSVDVYNPKVLRASQGVQFGLNVYSDVDFYDFIDKYSGMLIATTPYSDTSIYKLNLNSSVAWIFGNEGSGLSPDLLDKVKLQAKIPMAFATESINIAMAVTVCVFEMVRQRLC